MPEKYEPIAKGVASALPPVSIVNGVVTAYTGQDFFGNEAKPWEKWVAGAGAAFETANAFTKHLIIKVISTVMDIFAGVQTVQKEYEKQKKNENEKK